MPSLDILPIVHTLVSSENSADDTSFGPSYDPGVNLFGGGLNPRPRTLPESAVLTAPSAMADLSPSQAPGQGIAPLPAGALQALGVLGAFAGANSPLTPSDLDSTDPAPVGAPSYDPSVNLFGGLSPRPRTLPDSAVLPAPSAMTDISPSQAPGQGIAPLSASAFGALGVLAPFAGANSPLAPPDADSTDPAPPDGGPSYDPELQQLINGLSALGQPAPHSEPIQTSRNTSWHHVRINP